MLTPRQLRNSADRLEREAQAKLAEAQALRAAADQIDQLRGLTSLDHYAQNDQMAQAQTATPQAKIGRPLKIKGAGVITRAARELGLSLAELADALGTTYDSVRNWERPGRRVPDEFQPRLDALLANAKAAKNKPAK